MGKNLLLIAKTDLKESFRSKWFAFYLISFAALIALFFITGVADSRVAGFSGLSRMLLLFIQICVVVLPIFILITTTRTISAERESGALEYFVSFPISLGEYYFGKVLGRAASVFLPIIIALAFTVIVSLFKGISVPWGIFFYYCGILMALCAIFLAIGFWIGGTIKNSELALGVAFLVWIVLLAFIDLGLIGLMMRSSVSEPVIYAISLLNPIQVFRIAAISLFDTNLAVIGPAAYFILDGFGRAWFMVFSLVYPLFLGLAVLTDGFYLFKKKDLV